MQARAKKVLAYGAALAVLVGVLALYAQPQMMVALGDFMWACFN